jgi:hypothetical protein
MKLAAYGFIATILLSLFGKCAYDIRKSGEDKQQLTQATETIQQQDATIKDIKRVKKTREADLVIPNAQLIDELCNIISCIDDTKK